MADRIIVDDGGAMLVARIASALRTERHGPFWKDVGGEADDNLCAWKPPLFDGLETTTIAYAPLLYHAQRTGTGSTTAMKSTTRRAF